jgi:hypothetical protein
MPRLAALLLLLAACSSEPTDDALDDEGGSSGDSGAVGTEGDDDGESSNEGGSTGEPEPVWPPECVADGTCAGLEVDPGELACEVDGLDLTGIEVVWYRGDEETGITAECGEPLRATTTSAGVYSVLVAATWTGDGASWRCWTDEGGGGSAGPDLGEMHTWPIALVAPTAANDGGPPIGEQGGGCCLLSGTASDAFAQTPCEGA